MKSTEHSFTGQCNLRVKLLSKCTESFFFPVTPIFLILSEPTERALSMPFHSVVLLRWVQTISIGPSLLLWVIPSSCTESVALGKFCEPLYVSILPCEN